MYAPGNAAHKLILAQAHEREQQRRNDRQQDRDDGQQQRVAERLQKVDAVFRQKGKVKERRRRHADKEVAPPRGKIHGRDLLSDV